MTEQLSSPEAREVEHVTPIPEDLSAAYGEALYNKFIPSLTKAKTLFHHLYPPHTPNETPDEDQYLQDTMTTSLRDTPELFLELKTKKIGIVHRNDGVDFEISEEPNTTNHDTLPFPYRVDPQIQEMFRRALRHRFAHTGAGLSYLAIAQGNEETVAALKKVSTDMLEDAAKIFDAKNMTLIKDENGDIQLQLEKEQEPISIPPETVRMFGAALRWYINIDAVSQDFAPEIAASFGLSRTLQRATDTFTELETAMDATLVPTPQEARQSSAYELITIPFENNTPPFTVDTTAIEQPILGYLVDATRFKLQTLLDSLKSTGERQNSQRLQDKADQLQKQLEKLKDQERLVISLTEKNVPSFDMQSIQEAA